MKIEIGHLFLIYIVEILMILLAKFEFNHGDFWSGIVFAIISILLGITILRDALSRKV